MKNAEIGNKQFRKVFKRHAHKDDWGIGCVYEYSAWKIWKAAIKFERAKNSKVKK